MENIGSFDRCFHSSWPWNGSIGTITSRFGLYDELKSFAVHSSFLWKSNWRLIWEMFITIEYIIQYLGLFPVFEGFTEWFMSLKKRTAQR